MQIISLCVDNIHSLFSCSRLSVAMHADMELIVCVKPVVADIIIIVRLPVVFV